MSVQGCPSGKPGEACALQEGAGLVHPDVETLALRVGCVDYAERRADAARGERARVAVGEHVHAVAQEGSAVLAHEGVCAGVLDIDGAGRGVDRLAHGL